MISEAKKCQNCKNQFVIDEADSQFYEKMKVPPPTFCWLCRAQRRLAWRNERNLYKRVSDFSKKEIFSMYAPEVPVKVYERDVWNSDVWDSLDYGREYDFDKPFFKQFQELLHTVPLKNLNVVNGVNSDYVNNFTDPKNCYLVFNGNNTEDTSYGNGLTQVKECVDVSHLGKCETCYESFWCTNCNKTIFSSHCESSYNLAFCNNCVGSHDLFMCANLRKAQYCVRNQQYTKEEYEAKMKEFDLSSRQNLEKYRKEAKEFWNKFPRKYIEGSQNTNVSGNYIDHSRNVRNSFLVREGENLRYCQYVQEFPGSKECYDYSIWGDGSEFVYECCACGISVNNIKFCVYTQENVHDIEYSYCCSSSSYLFGCVGMKRKQYCIFNKQYTKEEYEALVPKIRAHMDAMFYTDAKGRIYKYGEFFPIEISPIAYNQSVSQEYFPFTKNMAEKEGFAWRDPHERNYKVTVNATEIPDKNKLVSDAIVNEIIGCMHDGSCNHNCTKAFKVIGDELSFYRKTNLPLPRLCPNCRHNERIAQRTKFQIYERNCHCTGASSEKGVYTNTVKHFHDHPDAAVGTPHPEGRRSCPNTFETNYAPDGGEILYCEQCYQAEVL